MIENVKTSTAAAPVATTDATSKDPRGGGSARPATSQTASTGAHQEPTEQSKPSTRLFIDQDKTTGVFVYRVVDAATGNLLVEIPSEQVSNLKDADGYAAGALISTSA